MDILILAAIAFYIFFKLSKHLGKIDEEEKRDIEAKIVQRKAEMLKVQQQILNQAQETLQKETKQQQQQEKVVGQTSTKDKILTSEEKLLASLNEATRQNLLPILQRCNMSAEFFLEGAKSAFEMVLKSFAEGNVEVLKSLLSEKIYQGFETAINSRKVEEKTLTTNLIAIVDAKITSAMMIENTASINVQFVSKQINYISNKAGEIVEGRKDEISEITDIWTFKKDITSPNPNWLVSSTGN